MPDRARLASRRRFLTVTGSAALALGSSAALTSCAPRRPGSAGPFNPAAQDWLYQLAMGIGATQINNVQHIGFRPAWKAWRPGVRKSVDAVQWYQTPAYIHPVPPVVLFASTSSSTDDPMTDRLMACVDTGRSVVEFDAWAWQAISIFVHQLTAGRTGADLAARRRRCMLALIPSGIRRGGRRPRGATGWVSYQARMGTVEIARIEDASGVATGVVTAAGLPAANGSPARKSFALPDHPVPLATS